MPDWAQLVFGPGTEFERASNRYFKIYTQTPEIARLTYGFFVRDVLDRCTEVIDGTLSPKRSLWYAIFRTFITENYEIKSESKDSCCF